MRSRVKRMIDSGKRVYVHANCPGSLSLTGDVIEGLIEYVDMGIPMGGFMTALVENDLRGTVSRADSVNIQLIPVIFGFIYNECPSGCFGSVEKVSDWIEHRGLNGLGEQWAG